MFSTYNVYHVYYLTTFYLHLLISTQKVQRKYVEIILILQVLGHKPVLAQFKFLPDDGVTSQEGGHKFVFRVCM